MPQKPNTSPEKFDSITHFLQAGNFNYRVFDMGRKIIPIQNDDFEKIEDQKELYPHPLQKKAWLALLFWEKSNTVNEEDNNKESKREPVIWFLQFPIDEMGFLKQEARDGFLINLLEQTGKNIQAKQSGDTTKDELGESPFAFKPQPDRLALFHALAMRELGQQPSQYYQHAQEYLSGKAGFEQWQFLGLQGIADIVARLGQDKNEALLAKAIAEMPQEVLESFCRALENINPKDELAGALIEKLDQEIEGDIPNVQLISMLLRAISGVKSEGARHEALLNVLHSPLGKEIEVLAAISGRAWNDLHSKEIMSIFIASLACQDQVAFNAILTDLMMMPKMRQAVMDIMRNPERPAELTHKLSEFMSVIKSTS